MSCHQALDKIWAAIVCLAISSYLENEYDYFAFWTNVLEYEYSEYSVRLRIL